jgi:Spy/CpxP family protein refolding chaperone
MKKLVSMFVAVLFVAGLCGSVMAGDDKSSEKSEKKVAEKTENKLEKHLDQLTKELNLTPEQREQVFVIMKEKDERRKTEMEKKQKVVVATKEDADTKIKAVLTPEQAAKFDKMKENQKEKMDKMKKEPKEKKDK